MRSLQLTVEHLDAGGHFDKDARVVFNGNDITVESDGGEVKGYLHVIGAVNRRSVLAAITVGGTISIDEATAYVDLVASIPMDGDIFAAPVPLPVEQRKTLFSWKNQEGHVLSCSLPQQYAGELKQTADNVYIGVVDRRTADGAFYKAEIQLTL